MNLLKFNEMPLKVAALEYGRMGWPVLPLHPRLKRPATKHGLMDATTDERIIADWWKRWPEANIGLRTGVKFDALDLDGEEGVAAMQRIKPGYLHNGPVSATGKGYHLLFAPSGSKNHARIFDEPVDFRGKRGYIVGPPSLHPLGHRYRWVQEASRLPLVPPWLAAHLFEPRMVRTTDPNDPSLRDAIERAGDLVELFESMGRRVEKGPGQLLVLSCPFHPGDNTPSLTIYPNNTFHCFGCEAWGDALNVRRWLKTGKLR